MAAIGTTVGEGGFGPWRLFKRLSGDFVPVSQTAAATVASHVALMRVEIFGSGRAGSVPFSDGANGGEVSALVAATMCSWHAIPSDIIRSKTPLAQSW
jgi:hypothetical protein